MNSIVSDIFATGLIETSAGEKVSIKPASIYDKEAEFLQYLIRKFQPKKTLEIGMGMGVSSIVICDALAEVGGENHIIIDPMNIEKWLDIARHNLKRIGFIDKVRFISGFSQFCLPKLIEEKQKVDFAMIDGWHTFDVALMDFFYVDKLLEVGGVIVLDDANWPALRKVCRYVATNYSYSIIPIPGTERSLKLAYKRKIVDALLKIPGLSGFLRRVLNPDIINSDKMLGLTGSMIAFRKESEDERSWSFHKEF